MTLYLDTSVLVCALTNEPQTRHVQDWMAAQDAGLLVISDWVVTEFASAMSIKLRTKQIGLGDRAEALAVFTRLSAESFTVLPIERGQFRAAARLADQYASGLRAGDALHLAVCADHAATLCTLDRKLGDAGLTHGVKTLIL